METLLKSWSWGSPGTEATRKTKHPKLDPSVDFCTCANTELMRIKRETNNVVGMSETDEVVQILDNFPKLSFS